MISAFLKSIVCDTYKFSPQKARCDELFIFFFSHYVGSSLDLHDLLEYVLPDMLHHVIFILFSSSYINLTLT